ncbi:glutamate--tRNA ligase [Candidatus Parcubacteria bacterium]|nr:glutamate--tRNA ligase [Candidatus Parcubacteria bacterium]
MKNNPHNGPVVRIAPSPTGNLHIGTARAALFNYLFAKRYGGKFILRIEDTDKERSKREYEGNIIEGLAWLGLSWDEFVRQSERTELYKGHLKRLVEEGKAYLSKEEVKKEGDRESVVRFRNPGTRLTFDDLIRGEISFDTAELGDFVIAKSLEEPLYHFAVVVDDLEMGVTHVIRGEDHISNTPRQILIGEALGAPRPRYAHIPLILAKDRSKLSKRHGATSLLDFRDKGYLPAAMANYLALLGWNPGTEEEFFSLDELTKAFDLGKVHKGGAVFDAEKLNWVNREYLRREPKRIESEVRAALGKKADQTTVERLTALLTGRVSTLGEVRELLEKGEFAFFEAPSYDAEKLNWKDSPAEATKIHLEKLLAFMKKMGEGEWKAETLKEKLMPYADEHGRGSVLWPMRYALTGRDKSPDPFSVAELLGKDESLFRIEAAIDKLHA